MLVYQILYGHHSVVDDRFSHDRLQRHLQHDVNVRNPVGKHQDDASKGLLVSDRCDKWRGITEQSRGKKRGLLGPSPPGSPPLSAFATLPEILRKTAAQRPSY